MFNQLIKQAMENTLERIYGAELSRSKKIYHIGATLDIIKSMHYDFWYHHCTHLFDRLYDLSVEQVMHVHNQYKQDQERMFKQRAQARSISSIEDDGC